jgi:hypothetical protein
VAGAELPAGLAPDDDRPKPFAGLEVLKDRLKGGHEG